MKNRFGIIDLGSNSCRLYIMEQQGPKPLLLRKERRVVRLGAGSFSEKKLTPAGMKRAAVCLMEFAGILKSEKITRLRAFTTSAVRDASNKKEFVDLVKETSGIDLEILSGEEEARAVYMGIKANLPLSDKTDLFLDIGGGSAEVICADCRDIRFIRSFPLGAVRLYERMLNDPGEVGEDLYGELVGYVTAEAALLGDFVKENPVNTFYGTSGTVLNLGAATAARLDKPYPETYTVKAEDLRDTIALLRKMDLKQKKSVPGLMPDRADIIIAGAAVLDGLMALASAREITVTSFSIKDGIAAELML
ncbi:MAG: hypothetical protein ILO36_07320 [Abditibacteriota bacterium]|nr:hypothetical protein [Abditibacteriota bacterium]